MGREIRLPKLVVVAKNKFEGSELALGEGTDEPLCESLGSKKKLPQVRRTRWRMQLQI